MEAIFQNQRNNGQFLQTPEIYFLSIILFAGNTINFNQPSNRVKRKMRRKIFDRVDQMVNQGGLYNDDIVHQLSQLLTKDEFTQIFQGKIKETERKIGQMETALRTQTNIDETFLSEWITVLADPLIPSCETLFEILRNVCLTMLDKPVKWDEIDILKYFLKTKFIAESSDVQAAIYKSLEKFVEDGNSDSIGYQEGNLGILPDCVENQFRYVAMKMGWHVTGEHFAKILFEVIIKFFFDKMILLKLSSLPNCYSFV